MSQLCVIASEQLEKRKQSQNTLQISSNEQLSHFPVAFLGQSFLVAFFATLLGISFKGIFHFKELFVASLE